MVMNVYQKFSLFFCKHFSTDVCDGESVCSILVLFLCSRQSPNRSFFVAVSISSCLMRLSPTRKALKPALCSIESCSWFWMPLSATVITSAGICG